MRNLNFTSMVRLFLLTCVLTLVPLSVAATKSSVSTLFHQTSPARSGPALTGILSLVVG